MESKKNEKLIVDNESKESSDNVKHLPSRRMHQFLKGLVPRCENIISRQGKESHKIYCPKKDSTEIKDNEENTKFEGKVIQIFKSVVLEDDQDMCDDNKTKQPLVTANRKNHTSSETEDAVHASEGTPAVTTAAISVAVADLPNASSPAPTTAVAKRFIPQRNYVETTKPQPAVEETEKHDGDKKNKPKEKIKVLKSSKDIHDLTALSRIIESCSAEYPGSFLKSTPAFDSYKELGELKETNVQILSEKTKLKNELSKVKKENSLLEKKLVRKKERNCILRSIIKEQVKMKSEIICAYNEMEEDQREQEEMTERREQYNRQVTETHEPEMCLKTRDVGLKQLRKEKEYVQRMEDHLDMLELENASIMAIVNNQKEEIEHLQRHLQDTHPGLEPSPSLAPTAARENKDISKKHTSVITEIENTMKSLQSEVSSLKTSKESSKRELEKYKQYYLEELRNKNLLLYELNRLLLGTQLP